MCTCQECGRTFRGQHPNLAPDQYGATAHRLGPRVKAAAHALHYGLGLPQRQVPAVLRDLTGLTVTQSALAQDALRRAEQSVGTAYAELRTRRRSSSRWCTPMTPAARSAGSTPS
ncbi:MAG: hypothetical protein HY329_23635 [Chloroflexi bacterium]|nr:hypothetical protein [Chloroflexota bacterium]